MKKPSPGVIRAILLSNTVSVFLFYLRTLGTGSDTYWFMLWNLILGWVPLVIAWALLTQLPKKTWREPLPVLLTLAWLAFLPNSFYMVSDLLHLKQTGDISKLFDIVMFMSFAWNGILAGFLSLRLIHRALLERTSRELATALIGGALLTSCFAIYLGRSLRWNSWDIVSSPGGLLYDVSERIINPFDYPQAFVTTTIFFLLLGSMYYVMYELVPVLPKKRR